MQPSNIPFVSLDDTLTPRQRLNVILQSLTKSSLSTPSAARSGKQATSGSGTTTPTRSSYQSTIGNSSITTTPSRSSYPSMSSSVNTTPNRSLSQSISSSAAATPTQSSYRSTGSMGNATPIQTVYPSFGGSGIPTYPRSAIDSRETSAGQSRSRSRSDSGVQSSVTINLEGKDYIIPPLSLEPTRYRVRSPVARPAVAPVSYRSFNQVFNDDQPINNIIEKQKFGSYILHPPKENIVSKVLKQYQQWFDAKLTKSRMFPISHCNGSAGTGKTSFVVQLFDLVDHLNLNTDQTTEGTNTALSANFLSTLIECSKLRFRLDLANHIRQTKTGVMNSKREDWEIEHFLCVIILYQFLKPRLHGLSFTQFSFHFQKRSIHKVIRLTLSLVFDWILDDQSINQSSENAEMSSLPTIVLYFDNLSDLECVRQSVHQTEEELKDNPFVRMLKIIKHFHRQTNQMFLVVLTSNVHLETETVARAANNWTHHTSRQSNDEQSKQFCSVNLPMLSVDEMCESTLQLYWRCVRSSRIPSQNNDNFRDQFLSAFHTILNLTRGHCLAFEWLLYEMGEKYVSYDQPISDPIHQHFASAYFVDNCENFVLTNNQSIFSDGTYHKWLLARLTWRLLDTMQLSLFDGLGEFLLALACLSHYRVPLGLHDKIYSCIEEKRGYGYGNYLTVQALHDCNFVFVHHDQPMYSNMKPLQERATLHFVEAIDRNGPSMHLVLSGIWLTALLSHCDVPDWAMPLIEEVAKLMCSNDTEQ